MRRHWIFGCAALLCAAPLLAHEGHYNKGLDDVDTDKDGFVTLAEAQANAPRLAEHFQDVDANKDGQLSKDELKSMHRMTHEKRKVLMDEKFKQADADGDSRLSRTEASGVPFVNEHFADLDADSDGFVTKDELGKMKMRRVHREHASSDDQKPETGN